RTFSGKLGTKLLFSTTSSFKRMVKRKCFIRKNLKIWEASLPHIEFSYNRVVNKMTSYMPFELVCDFNPLSPLDLVPLPIPSIANLEGLSKAQSMVKLHERVRQFMKKKGEKFPTLRKFKLLPRGCGPFLMLKRINENACVLDMPQEYKAIICLIFLTCFLLLQGGQDEQEKDITHKAIEDLQGLLTKGRLKRLEADI
ncbi:hypothetical protein CR513_16744, partial [Mucuna pruriens]